MGGPQNRLRQSAGRERNHQLPGTRRGATLEPIILEPPPDNRRPLADQQALRFHQNLVGLTPAKASDPNLLAWLNHFVLHEYGIKRWPRAVNSLPTNHIRRHWLTEAANDIYEASIAGRTYWIAETCFKAANHAGGSYTAEQAIALLSESAERYHYCMRFSFMRNPLVTAEYIRVLMNEAEGINRRGMMSLVRQINLEGGAKLIDALGRGQCRVMIVTAAEQAMTDERNVNDSKYLKGSKPLVVLSLGAGTQSTVMALMAEQGYNGMPKPDLAIFADTGWEPPSVYEHLEWLKGQLSYEVITVSAGNIKEDLLRGRNPADTALWTSPRTWPNQTAKPASQSGNAPATTSWIPSRQSYVNAFASLQVDGLP